MERQPAVVLKSKKNERTKKRIINEKVGRLGRLSQFCRKNNVINGIVPLTGQTG
jgi:flagellar biosynthesis/type III secretory pathway chaperone